MLHPFLPIHDYKTQSAITFTETGLATFGNKLGLYCMSVLMLWKRCLRGGERIYNLLNDP